MTGYRDAVAIIVLPLRSEWSGMESRGITTETVYITIRFMVGQECTVETGMAAGSNLPGYGRIYVHRASS